MSYAEMLRVRGLSYLAGVVNYEAGQAMVAWRVARRQQTSVLSALSRMVLLAYHDLVVLFALAAVGATMSDAQQAAKLRPFCWTGLAILLALGCVVTLPPSRWKERFRTSRWGAWLEDWSWRRSARLAGVRVVYFLIFVIYAATALRLGGIPLDFLSTLGTIPLVLLADALPSASGLGTRDAALQLLISTDRPSVLLAVSLTWSLGLLLGRLSIGLVNLWRPRRESPAGVKPAQRERAKRDVPADSDVPHSLTSRDA
jgi:hypothetical protein